MVSKDDLKISLDFFKVDFNVDQTVVNNENIRNQVQNYLDFWREFFKNYTFEQWNFLICNNRLAWWYFYTLEWILSWNLINEKTKLLYIYTKNHKHEVLEDERFKHQLENIQYIEIEEKYSINDCDYDESIKDILDTIKLNKIQGYKTVVYFEWNSFFFLYIKKALNNEKFSALSLVFNWFQLFRYYFEELVNLKKYCEEHDAIFWIYTYEVVRTLESIYFVMNENLTKYITIHKSYKRIFWSIATTIRSLDRNKNIYWLVKYQNFKN